jgi:hypothetical protein
MTHWSFKIVVFNLHVFEWFLWYSLLLSSNFIPLWSIEILGIISFFCCCCWGLFYDPGCGLFWKKFHRLLRNMYNLPKNEIFYKCRLSPFYLQYWLVLGYLCWLFWSVLSAYWIEWGVDISHYYCIWSYVFL